MFGTTLTNPPGQKLFAAGNEEGKMKIDAQDYVIIDGDKKRLLQVVGRHGNTFTGVVDNEYKYSSNKQLVTFEPDDVLAVLPSVVSPGRVYGIKVEPINNVGLIKPWGSVEYRRYVTDSEKALINRTLAHTGRIIHQSKLSSYLPITVEIRPHIAKENGWYIYTKRPGKLDTLILCPEQFRITTDDEFAKISLMRTIMHEFFHHIWFLYFTNELRTRWIRLFHQTIQVEEAGKDILIQLHKDFIDSGLFALQYRKHLKDGGEEVELFNDVIKHITKVHKLTMRDLNALLTEGSNLLEYWPKTPMQLSKTNPVISKYGTKNVEEFFAEAGSLMSVGHLISPNVANALNISMQMIGGLLPIVTRPQQKQAA
jgi:hypothetical protein